MIIADLIISLLTVAIAGYGTTMLLFRGPARLNVLECGCLAWLFGTGVVSLLLWLGGMVVSGVMLLISVAAASVVIGILGWRAANNSRLTFSFPSRLTRTEWILCAIIVLEIASVFWIALRHELSWDGLLNWEIKARYAFLNGGSLPARYYTSGSQTLTHPQYPLLIPMVELWLYLWMGVPHQFLVKIIFPIFYVVGVMLLVLSAARISGRRWIGCLIGALVFFVPFVGQSSGFTGGYVDAPLSIFYLAGVIYLILFALYGDKNSIRVCGACLAFLPWLKQEGAVLWLIGVTLALIIMWKRNQARTWLLIAAPGLLVILAWRLFLSSRNIGSPHDFLPFGLTTLHSNIGRLGPICRAIFSEIIQIDHWGIFWVLVAAAFIYQAFRARDACLLLSIVTVILPITAYAGAYLFSAWPDYEQHLRSSLPRLILQSVPIGWLVVALALSPPQASRHLALLSRRNS